MFYAKKLAWDPHEIHHPNIINCQFSIDIVAYHDQTTLQKLLNFTSNFVMFAKWFAQAHDLKTMNENNAIDW